MPNPVVDQFLDGLRTTRLLDDARIDELRARPEAEWGDVETLAGYAQERGWLTAYQARELRDGRGDGLTVGGYRIFDQLTDGPAGVTYKALHPALQQPVSLRLVKPDWLAPLDNTPDYVARTHAAALVQSPHVATVLDSGTHADAPYVVQEFVDGCNLFYLVNEMGALPLGLACEYTRQAALAVKAAHDRGVVHGEVSPFTLLLTPVKRAAGTNGDVSIRPRPGATVKLVELGLSPRRPAVGELTYGQSDKLGPLAFVPPERLTSGDFTPAGDLYGLGATLYFLLTTRPPHAGSSPLEVLHSAQHTDPAPLSSIKPDVWPVVSSLVGHLLARNPAQRPAADRVIDTLLPFCESPVMPAPETMPMSAVLIASETGTQPAVPTAVPVAKNLDWPDESEPESFAESVPDEPPAAVGAGSSAAIPLPDQPLVEPFSDRHLGQEVRPFDDHHEAFGHSVMGADKPRAPRPKAQPSSKNKAMIIAGLILHLTGTLMCLGWLGIIPNPFASKSTQDETPKVQKKDKGKKPPDTRRSND